MMCGPVPKKLESRDRLSSGRVITVVRKPAFDARTIFDVTEGHDACDIRAIYTV